MFVVYIVFNLIVGRQKVFRVSTKKVAKLCQRTRCCSLRKLKLLQCRIKLHLLFHFEYYIYRLLASAQNTGKYIFWRQFEVYDCLPNLEPFSLMGRILESLNKTLNCLSKSWRRRRQLDTKQRPPVSLPTKIFLQEVNQSQKKAKKYSYLKHVLL